MKQENLITVLDVLFILGGISRGTYRRLIAENNLPSPKVIGRRHWHKTKDLYKWLSELANRDVKSGDRLLSSKQLEKLFNMSCTWVWMRLQKNKKWKAKTIFLRSRPYWLLSELEADSELSKFIDVAKRSQT